MQEFPEAPPPNWATERLLTATVTGKPIEVAHAALRRLIESIDGVWAVSASDIQLQRGGEVIASLSISDTETWNAFVADLGVKPAPLDAGHRITTLQDAAAARVRKILDCPMADGHDRQSIYDFDPWDIFQDSLYGSYARAFDDCALDVLRDLRDGERRRKDLAADMLREMLCTADLCDYGTSPRQCFPTRQFEALLPELIEKWEAYVKIAWGEADG